MTLMEQVIQEEEAAEAEREKPDFTTTDCHFHAWNEFRVDFQPKPPPMPRSRTTD